MAPFLARPAGRRVKWLLPILTLAGAGRLPRRCPPPAEERRVFRYNQPEALTSLDPAFARNQANSWATFPALQRVAGAGFRPCSRCRPWPGTTPFRPTAKPTPSGCGPAYGFTTATYSLAAGAARSPRRTLCTASGVCWDGATASPGGWIFRGKVLEKPDGSISDTAFVAANDSTLRIHLKEPFIPFLGILTMPYAYVVPHEAVEKYGKDFREHPVGTGPFRFKLWDEGNVLLYERNPNYWRADRQGHKLPYLDAVAVSFLPDRKTEFLTFMQGKLDFLSGIRAGSRDLIMHPDGTIREDFKGKFTVQKAPYLNTEYLGIQLDSANLIGEQAVQGRALRDKRVRQALNYALNKPEMLTYLLNRVGHAGTSGFVPTALPSFSEKEVPGYTYQPQKSRQLLRAAGYGPQRPLRLRLSTVLERKEIGEYLQKQWADVGVQVQIDINQSAAQQDLVDNGPGGFLRQKLAGRLSRRRKLPGLVLQPQFQPRGPRQNPLQKRGLRPALRPGPPRSRRRQAYQALYQAMDRIVVEECPVISLYYDEVVRLTQNNVRGLNPEPHEPTAAGKGE
jgi:ABC-type transport system substrate-binding protein